MVVRIWTMAKEFDFSTMHCICTLEDAQTRTIRSIEWSPDGRMMACASFDGTVVVWKAQNHTLLHWDQIASLDGHENECKSVSWSKVGFFVATCGRDKKIWVWEQEEDGEFDCIGLLEGHTQDVKFVIWHPQSTILYSCSYDDTVKIWRESDDEFYCAQTLTSHKHIVWCLSIDPNPSTQGKLLYSSGADLCVKIFQSDEAWGQGEYREMFSIPDVHRYPIYSLQMGYEHEFLATGSGDNHITLLHKEYDSSNMPFLSKVKVLENAHDADINCVRWGPYIESDEEEEKQGDTVFTSATANQNKGHHVENSFDTHYILASCADDGLVKVWRLVMEE